MQIKSFGTLLIIIGLFMSFSFFIFCQWRMDLDFMGNLHYAALYEYSTLDPNAAPGVGYLRFSPTYIVHKITLGQSLLLPLFLVLIGIVFNREVLESKLVIKLLPFLK